MSKGYGSVDRPMGDMEVDEGAPLVSSKRGESRIVRLQWKQVAVVALVGGILLAWLVPKPKVTFVPTSQGATDYFDPNFPSTVERYYEHQTFDHFKPRSGDPKHWSQHYYEDTDFFQGPGSPIFLIMGGEDPIYGILYPFISRHLAQRFGAYTACLEHRFYGTSQPTENPTNKDLHRLLHPRQAIADALKFVEYKRKELGCGPKGTPEYCPVMTVGASYPGFLAALLRIDHPEAIDIGYASSAPLHLYSHNVDHGAYFEKISDVAEFNSPGCAAAVKESLLALEDQLLAASFEDIDEVVRELGICPESVPDYIQDMDTLRTELNIVFASHFAEANMGFYPPSEDAEFVQSCRIFQEPNTSLNDKISQFLLQRQDYQGCFDLMTEVPPGYKGTISAADWSGVGGGYEGLMWDYQSCTLIPENGMSAQSMFPERPWTMEWLTEHCQDRFDYTPVEDALKDEFHFDDLSDVTRMLFTNGISDGWSVASITTDLSDSVRAVNMIHGAHHSDLSHTGPSENDTDDVKAAHVVIGNLVAEWLDEVYAETQG